MGQIRDTTTSNVRQWSAIGNQDTNCAGEKLDGREYLFKGGSVLSSNICGLCIDYHSDIAYTQ
jgi:hypothetical protein